jgi:hypothetical protein
VTIGTCSYHVRALHGASSEKAKPVKRKLIRLTSTGQVRGAIVHYYRLTEAGRAVVDRIDNTLGGAIDDE